MEIYATFSKIRVSTTANFAFADERDPQPYLFFKSERAFLRTSKAKTLEATTKVGVSYNIDASFPGPHSVNLGSSKDPKDVTVEVWDADFGRDHHIATVKLDFAKLQNQGTRSIDLPCGGVFAFNYEMFRPSGPPTVVSGPIVELRMVALSRLPAKMLACQEAYTNRHKLAVNRTPSCDPDGGVVRGRFRPSIKLRQDMDQLEYQKGYASFNPTPTATKSDFETGSKANKGFPSVVIRGKSRDVSIRYPAQLGNGSPEWLDTKTLPYDPCGFTIEVLDVCEKTSYLVGIGEFALPCMAEGESSERLELSNKDGLTIQWAFDPKSIPEEEPVPGLAKREEIRKMTAEGQERFALAVKHMMVNKDGPGTSEFAKIAHLHGCWPSNEEMSAVWRRGYLCTMEQRLRQADRELGNSGNIGLPYWDWTRTDVNGEIVPKIIRDHFANLPENIVLPAVGGKLLEYGYTKIRSDDEIRNYMNATDLNNRVDEALLNCCTWCQPMTRACAPGLQGDTPFDTIQMAVGFPLSSLQFASFHPLFYLHMCNVDRLYEKRIFTEGQVNSVQEFESMHASAVNRGEESLFRLPLRPFRHPINKMSELWPQDTFDLFALGFMYAELPATPVLNLNDFPVLTRQSCLRTGVDGSIFTSIPNGNGLVLGSPPRAKQDPLCAVFKVPAEAVESSALLLHVFVIERKQASNWKAPEVLDESSWVNCKEYAGCAAIFGRRSKSRPSLRVSVPIEVALVRLGLSRHNISLRIFCEDELGNIVPFNQTGLTKPSLVGSVFEDPNSALELHDGGNPPSTVVKGEVFSMQKALQMLGYLPKEFKVDGVYNQATKAAVQKYQKFCGIEPADGIANKTFKQWLSATRIDVQPDIVPKMKVNEKRFEPRKIVDYTVGPMPGYLNRTKVLAEIDRAFANWGKNMLLKFQWVPSTVEAEFRIDFVDLSKYVDDTVPVQRLLKARAQDLIIDVGVRWLLVGDSAPSHVKEAFDLYPAVLHGIGRCLGAENSDCPLDVMWPFYSNERAVDLTIRDRRQAMAKVELTERDEITVCKSMTTRISKQASNTGKAADKRDKSKAKSLDPKSTQLAPAADRKRVANRCCFG